MLFHDLFQLQRLHSRQYNSHNQYIDNQIQGYIMKHICWKEILTPGKEKKIGDITEYSRSFQVFNYIIILIFKL